MSRVNVMYQISLRQFLTFFDTAIKNSKPTHIIEKRVTNIIDYLTRTVWRSISRGLYEQDKLLFTLLLALKVDLNKGSITYNEFLTFLKGGGSLDMDSAQVFFANWVPCSPIIHHVKLR